MNLTLKPQLRALGAWAYQNRVPLQIGAGVIFNAGALVATVYSTKKAIEAIGGEKLTAKEKLKRTWKYALVPTGLAAAGTGCLVSAAKGHIKQVAGLTTALASAEALGKEYLDYREKICEKVGEKVDKETKTEVIQDKINKSTSPDDEDTIPGEGPEVFYDTFLDRYFKSSVDKIQTAALDLRNAMLNAETRRDKKNMRLELNKFYVKLGLPKCSAGEVNTISNYDTDGCRDPFSVEFYAAYRRDGKRTCQAISYNVVPIGITCLPF